MLPSRDTSQSSYDEKILKYAVELFRQLGISKPEPDTIFWDDSIGPDLVVVKYGEVRLPRKMMGKLTAEHWKPLLAPPIIYSYFVLRDPVRDYALRLFLPLAIGFSAVGFDILQIFRSSQPDHVWELNLASVVILLLYIPVTGLYVRRRWRSLSYTADGRAADTIGREVFLEAFAKYRDTISAMGFLPKRLHFWPTLSQRIERLQKDLR